MIARVMAASVQPSRPIQASMQRKLSESLSPVVLNIVNESHKHAGHAGNPGGGPDAETHFRCGSTHQHAVRTATTMMLSAAAAVEICRHHSYRCA